MNIIGIGYHLGMKKENLVHSLLHKRNANKGGKDLEVYYPDIS